MSPAKQRGPQVPLDTFPKRRWGASNSFFRVAGADDEGNWYSPWWFCNDGKCRFDLPAGHERGTLHAATDAATAILEYIGDAEGQVVTLEFLERRQIYELAYDTGFDLAHLASASAVGFGATNSISAMLNYQEPQEWAAAFDAIGFEGIFFCARHVTSGRATALALFDEAGSHDWVVRRTRSTTTKEIIKLLDKRKIKVERPPKLADLQRL